MLPYDAETLYAFLALVNRALWPVQPLVVLLALAALGLAARPRNGPWSGRLVALLLALAWAWVGWDFFLRRFAELDFMAPLYGAAFLLQALLLAVSGLLRRRPVHGAGRVRFAPAGLALAALALFLYPLAGALLGGDWTSAPLVGLMPGPTALFTLGLLLCAGGRGALPLAVLPLLWCLVAGFEGWALGLPQDLALPLLGLAGFALLLLGQRRGLSEGLLGAR